MPYDARLWPRVCDVCQHPITQDFGGRPKHYCSKRCREKAMERRRLEAAAEEVGVWLDYTERELWRLRHKVVKVVEHARRAAKQGPVPPERVLELATRLENAALLPGTDRTTTFGYLLLRPRGKHPRGGEVWNRGALSPKPPIDRDAVRRRLRRVRKARTSPTLGDATVAVHGAGDGLFSEPHWEFDAAVARDRRVVDPDVGVVGGDADSIADGCE
jgi:hypothetical protein